MKHNSKVGGLFYYRKGGLVRSIIVHLTDQTHRQLKKLAEREDRSLQATARRMIEEGLKKASGAA